MISERYTDFLRQYGWGDKPYVFLAGDCSERKYYRLGSEITGFVLLMDSPSSTEKLEEFVKVGSILSDLGFSVPEVIAYDLDKGLALIEDLGDTTYSQCLLNGQVPAYNLYDLATQVLIDLHKKFETHWEDISLPPYSMDLYMREVNLCLEWYYGSAYSTALSPEALKDWETLWTQLLEPQINSETLVLRDFMIDNLVYLKKRQGVQKCGLLDFQDAVCGSRAYDLVSLLEDARYDVPRDIQKKMINKYLEAFPDLDRESFLESYSILGAQRSVKILGIFTRMYKRYNKSKYLAHLPRVLKWLEQDLGHPSLRKMKDWFDLYMPNTERKALNAD